MDWKSSDLKQILSATPIETETPMTITTITKAIGRQEVRPRCVGLALIALWTAWVASAVALFVNQLVFRGSGIGPGLELGILSLIVQAIVFIFVARGRLLARALTVVFLVLAALPLQMLGRMIVEASVWSATYIAVGFSLKAIAVFLLFTAGSKRWFASQG
jgi:hypothetical protein